MSSEKTNGFLDLRISVPGNWRDATAAESAYCTGFCMSKAHINFLNAAHESNVLINFSYNCPTAVFQQGVLNASSVPNYPGVLWKDYQKCH